MQTWAITDPGNIREQNQDAYAVINFGHERIDRKSTRLNSSHVSESRMPSSA